MKAPSLYVQTIPTSWGDNLIRFGAMGPWSYFMDLVQVGEFVLVPQKISTLMPRILGYLDPHSNFPRLRDPTHDLRPENWNSYERTTGPGVLGRNASPYQKCSQECFTVPKVFFLGEIKSCSVQMIHHSAEREWTQRWATRRSALMTRHLSTSSISYAWEVRFQTLPDSRNVRWHETILYL